MMKKAVASLTTAGKERTVLSGAGAPSMPAGIATGRQPPTERSFAFKNDCPDHDEDNYYDPEEALCWLCHGDGWGIVGVDWDCDDAINGPYDGEIERCPCCHGSGKAEDCTFW